MSYIKKTEKALKVIRGLPRVSMLNIRDNPGAKRHSTFGRGQHRGKTHGCGAKDRLQTRLGYETGNFPFYLRPPIEPYYKDHAIRREYVPITMDKLQKMIDTNRLDVTQPIDVVQLCNTGLLLLRPEERQYGFQLKDEGISKFKAKIHIEVQHASELIISTIERNGGVIRSAFYDPISLMAMKDTERFFKCGKPIPKRMVPPQDAVEYYSDPKNRGYLADPEAIAKERLILAQKYGYDLPKIEDDPQYEMFSEVKDPRQIFFGLEPGWLVNLVEKTITHIDPESPATNTTEPEREQASPAFIMSMYTK